MLTLVNHQLANNQKMTLICMVLYHTNYFNNQLHYHGSTSHQAPAPAHGWPTFAAISVPTLLFHGSGKRLRFKHLHWNAWKSNKDLIMTQKQWNKKAYFLLHVSVPSHQFQTEHQQYGLNTSACSFHIHHWHQARHISPLNDGLLGSGKSIPPGGFCDSSYGIYSK